MPEGELCSKNFTTFLHDFALTAHASGPCSLAVMHIMHIFQTLGNATIDQHRASWESRRLQAFHVSVWVRSLKAFLPRKNYANVTQMMKFQRSCSTCPLVHDRLKKLFHLSMWQQGGCWTSVLLWSPNPYGSIMTSLEWSKPWLWSKRNQTHKIQVANLVRWVILEGDRNPRCLQRGHSKLIPKWIAKTPEPNMNLVHPQTN